jgi:hypothetical protein
MANSEISALLDRRAEPCCGQQRAEFVAVQPGGM